MYYRSCQEVFFRRYGLTMHYERMENENMARPKKNAPAKAAAPSVLEAVKETVAAAKVSPKKTAAPKAAQKTEEIYLQAGGAEWNVSDCKERVIAAFVEKGHRASSVKKLVVYLKPEEGRAYYVINDSENGSIDL